MRWFRSLLRRRRARTAGVPTDQTVAQMQRRFDLDVQAAARNADTRKEEIARARRSEWTA